LPERATIIAKDINGGEISRASSIRMGDDVTFEAADGCIPDVIDFEIRDESNPNVILQAVTVNTKCTAGGIQLAESAGALDFTGYTCDGGKERNCFTDVLFEVCTQNVGTIPMQVRDMILSFDSVESSPLKGAPTVLEGTETCLQETREITLCEQARHVAEVDVEACKCLLFLLQRYL
jgi:hypothetical protein